MNTEAVANFQGTSFADLASALQVYRQTILYFLLGLPTLGPLFGKVLVSIKERVGAWFLSVVVHAAVFMIIPSVMGLAYVGFYLQMNLFTEVDVLLFFGPLFSGLAALFLVPKVMALDDIPGFDRLFGLFVLVGVTSFLMALIVKTRLYFVALARISFKDILVGAFLVFLVLRWAMYKVTSGGGSAAVDPYAIED